MIIALLVVSGLLAVFAVKSYMENKEKVKIVRWLEEYERYKRQSD